MRVGFSGEGMNETHLVGECSQMWHQIGDHLSGLAFRAKFPGTFCEVSLLALKRDEALGAGHGLPVAFDEFGLVVKRVHLADRSGAEDHQHAFGPCLEVGGARGVGVCGLYVRPDGGRA